MDHMNNGATREVMPGVVPAGEKISEEDRLTIENIFLKMQNLQLQMSIVDLQKVDMVRQLKELQDLMKQKKGEFEVKYKTSMEPGAVSSDGRIVRTTTADVQSVLADLTRRARDAQDAPEPVERRDTVPSPLPPPPDDDVQEPESPSN